MLSSVTSSDLSPSPMTQHTRTDSSLSSTQSTAPWAEDVCVRPSAATDCLGSVATPLCPILFIYNRVRQIGKGKFCVHYGNGIRLESLSLQLSILNKNPRSIYMLRQQAQDIEKNKGEMPFAQVLFPNCSLSISIVMPSFLWELPKPPSSHVGFSDLSQAVLKQSRPVSAFLGSSHWKLNTSSAYRDCLINDQNADSLWKIF